MKDRCMAVLVVGCLLTAGCGGLAADRAESADETGAPSAAPAGTTTERCRAPQRDAGDPVRVVVPLRARNERSGSGRFDHDVRLSALGATGTVCGLMPEGSENPLPVDQAAEQGRAISGSICFVVNPDDAVPLVLVIDAAEGVPHRVYLATG